MTATGPADTRRTAIRAHDARQHLSTRATDSWAAASPTLGLIDAGTDQLEAVCGALCPTPRACRTVVKSLGVVFGGYRVILGLVRR